MGQRVPTKIHENIENIAELYGRLEQRVDRHQRVIETATRAIARPGVVYALLALVLGWIAANLVAPALGRSPIDAPPFFWLDSALSLYAAVVTTIVLTTQSRQNLEAHRRAQLELQVNLLAEQKTTKVIQLLEELRRDLPMVDNREDPIASAMQEEVDPHAVIEAMEEPEP